jgi:hypothetical protein
MLEETDGQRLIWINRNCGELAERGVDPACRDKTCASQKSIWHAESGKRKKYGTRKNDGAALRQMRPGAAY